MDNNAMFAIEYIPIPYLYIIGFTLHKILYTIFLCQHMGSLGMELSNLDLLTLAIQHIKPAILLLSFALLFSIQRSFAKIHEKKGKSPVLYFAISLVSILFAGFLYINS